MEFKQRTQTTGVPVLVAGLTVNRIIIRLERRFETRQGYFGNPKLELSTSAKVQRTAN